MSDLSIRDVVWMVLLGGAAAAYLGWWLFRAVQRGRCAGCEPTGTCCTPKPARSEGSGHQPLHFRIGGKRKPGGPVTRANGNKAGGSRTVHRLIGLLGLPLIFLLLASGFALLFANDLHLADRPLPRRLALALYGSSAGQVVAEATAGEHLAVAVADGVITRVGNGPWRGVRWTTGAFRVRDVAWLPMGQLACATDGGVWISADGTTWDYRADSAAGLPGAVSRLAVADGRIWAQSVLGPRVSDDGGVSWHAPDGTPPPALADRGEPAMESPPVGASAAWLQARGWPTWEKLVIDLHAGNLFGGRWRYVVLLSWGLLLGLAISGPVVAQRRRQHLKEREAARAARRTLDPGPEAMAAPGAGAQS
jgi:hypothetical protein